MLNVGHGVPAFLRALRDCDRSSITIRESRIHVPTSNDIAAANVTCVSTDWNWAIHTGIVVQPSRLAMVNSPKTSARVSAVADNKAARRLGSMTLTRVRIQVPPKEREASTNVFRSMALKPASSDRYTKGIARTT